MRTLKCKKLDYNYKNIVRLYDVYAEKKFYASEFEKSIFKASYYLFMKEYDIAICIFNDAFNSFSDEYIKLLLMIKIAECLSYSDIYDERAVIDSIEKLNHGEMNSYIDKSFDYITNIENINCVGDMECAVELHESMFRDGIEEKYRKLINRIERNIFKT